MPLGGQTLMPNNLLRRSALRRSALPRQTFEATYFHHQPIIQRPAFHAHARWGTSLHSEQPTSKVCLGEADLRHQRPAIHTYARWGTSLHSEQPTSKVCLGEADLRHQRPAIHTYARWGTSLHSEQPTSKVCLGEADLRHHPTPSFPCTCPLGNKSPFRTTYFEGLPRRGRPTSPSNAQRPIHMPVGEQTFIPDNLLRRSASARQTYDVRL